MLADLHDRLHVIPAPDWLPDVDDGDRLVHLDLHPLNVMITAIGTGRHRLAERGARRPRWLDVAVTFVLLTCPRVPGSRLLNRAVATDARRARAHVRERATRAARSTSELVLAAAAQSARHEHVAGRSRRVRAARRACTRAIAFDR